MEIYASHKLKSERQYILHILRRVSECCLFLNSVKKILHSDVHLSSYWQVSKHGVKATSKVWL